MAQAITTQSQAITTEAEREGAFRENPHVGTMAIRVEGLQLNESPSLL